VSEGAGVVWRARPGDAVHHGQVLFELHTDRPDSVPGALEALEGAAVIGDDAPPPTPLVLDRIG